MRLDEETAHVGCHIANQQREHWQVGDRSKYTLVHTSASFVYIKVTQAIDDSAVRRLFSEDKYLKLLHLKYPHP